jgi:transcriptional regulator with XRE-family HTH domain
MKISEVISRHRKIHSLTFDQLAEKTGLSKAFLSRLEKGDFDSENISLATIIRLSKGMDVKTKEILDLLNVIDQEDPMPLKVYLRKKYDIRDESHLRAIESLIDHLK